MNSFIVKVQSVAKREKKREKEIVGMEWIVVEMSRVCFQSLNKAQAWIILARTKPEPNLIVTSPNSSPFV